MTGIARRRYATVFVSLLAAAGPSASRAQDDGNAPTFKPEELEQIVAPVALYSDSLLAQVFMASTYPLEVVEAARFQKENPKLTGQALDDALKDKTWDASVKSLVAFPQVLTMMNDKLDWTQKLGDAFLAQQGDVMDAVQRLRAKAKAAGNLETSPQQTVIEQPSSGGQTIIQIQPADPQVVYVPSYNPTVVYGSWPYPSYPPYSYYPPGYVAGSALWFGAGMAVGAALWGNCNWGWGGHGNIDVNYNNYNNFNQSVSNNFNRNNVQNKFQNGKWQHDPAHRQGVGYRDKGTQDRFGKGQRPGVSNREAFRGRAEAGRQDLARGGSDRFGDRGGQGVGDRGGNRGGQGVGDRGGNRAGQGVGGNRGGAGVADRSANRGGNRGGAGFQGIGNGRDVSRDSARGRQSRQQSAANFGNRGGGGGGRSMGGGGGGGGRGGGGGGRGGGGGGRGGGGGGRGGGGGGRRR